MNRHRTGALELLRGSHSRIARAIRPDCCSSARGGVSLNPVRVHLPAGKRSEVLLLKNGGSAPTRFQLAAFVWQESSEGEMKLYPTGDLLFFPSLLEIKPGATRRVRVASSLTPGSRERSYRIVASELPGPSKSGVVQVVTNLNIPVFVQAVEAPAKPRVTSRIVKGELLLSVENLGLSYFKTESEGSGMGGVSGGASGGSTASAGFSNGGVTNGGVTAGSAGRAAGGSSGTAGSSGASGAACERIRSDYASEPQMQASCDPRVSRPQCADRVSTAAGCQCRVFIQPKDPFAIESLANIEDDWLAAACSDATCPSTCSSATRATCQPDASFELGGRCVGVP